jgi:hypothetical protein
MRWYENEHHPGCYAAECSDIDAEVEKGPLIHYWTVRPAIDLGGSTDFYAMGAAKTLEEAMSKAEEYIFKLREEMRQNPYVKWYPHPPK